jgi:hypothetical protein
VPTFVSIIANAYIAHLSTRWVPAAMDEGLYEGPVGQLPALDWGQLDGGGGGTGSTALDLPLQFAKICPVAPEPFGHSVSCKHTGRKTIKHILMV